MLHEVWIDSTGLPQACFAGPWGDAQRALMEPGTRLIWTFEAQNYFEAMTLYWEYMGWGTYTSDFEELDRRPYTDTTE